MNDEEWARRRVQCAWCRKIVRDGDGPTTHTICKDCATNALNEVNTLIGEAAEMKATLRLAGQ